MKTLLLALALSTALSAQVNFYIDNSNGALPTSQLSPLPSTYTFADTPAGTASSIVLRVVNSSASSVLLGTVFIGAAPNSAVQTPNFTVTGLGLDVTLAPQAWKLFTLNFTPVSTGPVSGYLQVQVNGIVGSVATLSGTGTTPQLTLTCTSVNVPQPVSQCNGSAIPPNTNTPLKFGNVPTTSSAAIQFTLSNESSGTLNPQNLISLATQTNDPNPPFQLSALPATLAPNSSINFTLTFAPGDTSTTKMTLQVGFNFYFVQGTGVGSTVGDISSLVITYTDSTGVRLPAQPATPISFGQTIAGTNATAALTFIVTNPQTTIDAVNLPAISVTGAGFAVSFSGTPVPPCSSAASLPTAIQPGQCISFQVIFSGSTVGNYNGTLSIGSRQFTLSGQTITLPIPAVSFQMDELPLTSQRQAHLTIQLASPSQISAIGTLTMQFVPLVNNVKDDPAIYFVTTGGRRLDLTVSPGSKTANYKTQSSLTFQTGTTAGTLTLTLTFPNAAPLSQSYVISPATVQITAAQAVRQSPNLVVTLTGYDNTYSTGQLSFTFYDTGGRLLTPSGIAVNASSTFQQYFFSSDNQAGGAFRLQASFPVNGDVTQVGSVGVSISNSVGPASVNQTFQ